MSVLEFIAAWKWPVVVLVALAVVSRGFKRNPDMGAWFRRWLDSRDVRGKIGPTEFEATASNAVSALQAAAATDAELGEVMAAEPDMPQPSPDEVSRAVTDMRREAVEEVMRSAARWGFDLARAGANDFRAPHVEWTVNGHPLIKAGRAQTGDLGNLPQLRPIHHRLLDAIEARPDDTLQGFAETVGISLPAVASAINALDRRGLIIWAPEGSPIGVRRPSELTD